MTAPDDPQKPQTGETPVQTGGTPAQNGSRFAAYAVLGAAALLAPILAVKKFQSGIARGWEQGTKTVDDKVSPQQPPKPPAPR